MLPITTNENALDAFMGTCVQVQDLAQQIKEHANNHFDTESDEVNWADVGQANYIKEQLQQVLDFMEDKE